MQEVVKTEKPKRRLIRRNSIFNRQNLPVALLLAPYLIIFVTFFVYPFLYGIIISLFRWNIFNPDLSRYVGFENYRKILFGIGEITLWKERFWEGLKNTLIFVVISVPLLIIIPLFIAVLLDIEPRFYKVFRIIFFLPTILSVSAVSIIFKWQFDTNYGFVNALLSVFGIKEIAWLNTQPGAWIAILVTTIWWTIGTNTVIYSAGLKEVDRQLYEAAEIDGCNYGRLVWHVSLPSIRQQLFLTLITTTIASFGIYGQADILTGGGPQRTTTVLMMVIRGLLTGTNAQPGLAAAMALLMGILIIIIGVIQNVYNKRKGA